MGYGGLLAGMAGGLGQTMVQNADAADKQGLLNAKYAREDAIYARNKTDEQALYDKREIAADKKYQQRLDAEELTYGRRQAEEETKHQRRLAESLERLKNDSNKVVGTLTKDDDTVYNRYANGDVKPVMVDGEVKVPPEELQGPTEDRGLLMSEAHMGLGKVPFKTAKSGKLSDAQKAQNKKELELFKLNKKKLEINFPYGRPDPKTNPKGAEAYDDLMRKLNTYTGETATPSSSEETTKTKSAVMTNEQKAKKLVANGTWTQKRADDWLKYKGTKKPEANKQEATKQEANPIAEKPKNNKSKIEVVAEAYKNAGESKDKVKARLKDEGFAIDQINPLLETLFKSTQQKYKGSKSIPASIKTQLPILIKDGMTKDQVSKWLKERDFKSSEIKTVLSKYFK